MKAVITVGGIQWDTLIMVEKDKGDQGDPVEYHVVIRIPFCDLDTAKRARDQILYNETEG